MNSVPAFMNSFLVAVVIFSVYAPHRTSAAVCSPQTSYQCVASDNTLAICNRTTLLCDCKPGYQPIPTGCASKMAKPDVSLATGRIGQRVPNAKVTLTCMTKETGTLTFAWKKNDILLPGENKPDLTRQGDDTTVLGKYSCMVNETSLGLTSDYSAEVDILTFNVAGVTPVVTVSTQTAAPGVDVEALCNGIPYGATYKFKLVTSNKLVDTVTQDTSQTGGIICVLDDIPNVTWTKKESGIFPMPQAANDITGATISPAGPITVQAGVSVPFTCATNPLAKFMETSAAKIAYTFVDSGNPSPPAASTYTLTSTAAEAKKTRTVSCSAKYGASGTVQKSSDVVVTLSDNYVPTPSLNASSTTVSTGSRVYLTCAADPSVQISWTKDGKTIPRETERTIQLGNFQPTDAGKYVCSATKDFSTVNSKDVLISSHAPELRVLGSTVTVLVAVLSWRVI